MAIIRQIVLSIEEVIEATFGRHFMFEPEGSEKTRQKNTAHTQASAAAGGFLVSNS
jgi:hypothetical protein